MRIELVCIGTELLRGKVNTHAGYISEKLSEAGLVLAQETTVGDDPADMEQVFIDASERADVVLSTGGLGPTFDDLTREGWSRVLGVPLRRHPSLVTWIRGRFRSRGLAMPPHNARQADILEGARVIPNRVGTAPGQILEDEGKIVILLPGPPSEMYPMMEQVVMPLLRRKIRSLPYDSFTLHTFGTAESAIDQRIRPVIGRKRSLRKNEWLNFCILAHRRRVDVKAEARAATVGRLKSILDGVKRDLLRAIGPDVFGQDDETLESIVGNLLIRKKLTLALAESCTGGLLGEMITRVPGSSSYFVSSIVTYANAAKQKLLGVRKQTFSQYGAVSPQTAIEMAKGAQSSADIGVSITGIAGPEGGSRQKPVGLVFIGFASAKRHFARRYVFHGGRAAIRERAAMAALDLLRRELEGK